MKTDLAQEPHHLISDGAGISKQRIFVDVSVLAKRDAGTGIQRVVLAVLREWAAQPVPGRTVELISAEPNQPYRRVTCFVPGRAEVADEPLALGSGDVFLGLDLAAHILPRQRRQLGQWRRNGAKLAVVIYDLLPITNPAWFGLRLVWRFQRWLKFVCRTADLAICISKDVAVQLADWRSSRTRLLRHPLRIEHIGLGSDFRKADEAAGLSASDEAFLAKLAGTRPILAVGTIEPRKGHAVLLDAMEQLWRNEYCNVPLVIVGRPGWKTRRLQDRLLRHPMAGHLLHWLSDASDQLLEQLYELNPLLVATSWGEGFCLPIAEALDHGNVVLARDIPVFREFGELNMYYFDDDAAIPLSRRIGEVLHEPAGSARQPVRWSETIVQLEQLLANL